MPLNSWKRRWVRFIVGGFGIGYWLASVIWTLQQEQYQYKRFSNSISTLTSANACTEEPPFSMEESEDKDSAQSSQDSKVIQSLLKIPASPSKPVSSTARERKSPDPLWWKHYVKRLTKVWASRSVESWCHIESDPPTPTLLRRGEVAQGMIYIKMYKASSSTCEGVAQSIAHHVGRRRYNNSRINSVSQGEATCRAYTRHEFANQRMHARRDPERSLLWTFVRNPAARDLSHIYHFEIGRNHRSMTSQDIQKQIQLFIKGRQTRYLVPTKTSAAPLWPVHELRKNRTDLVMYLKAQLFENYDFIGLTERMSESLACMVLLWDLQPTDVIVLNSKKSGGFDDGGGLNHTCTVIPKAKMTSELKKYFETKHPIWNADVLLYQAANASLDLTIETLGYERVMAMARMIEKLQTKAHEMCLEKAVFPCSPEGVYQPKLAEKNCFVQDSGCGHKCVDEVLLNAAAEKIS